MSTKHTPGPWLRDGRSVYVLEDIAGHWHNGEPLQQNRFYLHVQGPSSTPREELEAVAMLAQAAPDLLKGLKRYAIRLENEIDERQSLGLCTESDEREFEEIRAAIAKAEDTDAD